MLAAAAIALVAIAVLAWLIGAPLLRERRRRAAMARPLPPALRAHIDRNLPLRARLPAALVARHDALVGAFLDEKEFVGCDGLEVSRMCSLRTFMLIPSFLPATSAIVSMRFTWVGISINTT